MKGTSIGALADALEVRQTIVSNWLFRAAKQCKKPNKYLMKDVNVSKVDMDELWVIVRINHYEVRKRKIRNIEADKLCT
jgi:hypothetical protein